MARRMLKNSEIPTTTRVVVDEDSKGCSALYKPRLVERQVQNSRKLLTVDVGKGDLLIGQSVDGAIVRLRPTEDCAASDLDRAEARLRKSGATAIMRLPLRSHEQVVAEQEQSIQEPGVTLKEALLESLSRILRRDGVNAEDAARTTVMAEVMLAKAGG